MSENDNTNVMTVVQFVDESGNFITDPIQCDIHITKEQLGQTCLSLLQEEEDVSYALFVRGFEIEDTLHKALEGIVPEGTVQIEFQRQVQFRVKSVTRNIGDLPGHSEAVVCLSFSLDSRFLATGSGDTTVRLWDVGGVFCFRICQGHKNWVMCVSWAPDTSKLASGCRKGMICIWDPISGSLSQTLKGHTDCITGISWEPLHRATCRKFASASKDHTIRVWDSVTGQSLLTLFGHAQSVTTIRWGGLGYIYSGSRDRTVRVWKDDTGSLQSTLVGHAHWVNSLALSTDGAIITCAFGLQQNIRNLTLEERYAIANTRFMTLHKSFGEKLISVSDDKTAILWHPEVHSKIVARLTGHQQTINDVSFSPDGKYIATASFDHSIKIWHAQTGNFISTLRGHIQAVYKMAWCPDSKLLATCSGDSTVKVWQMETFKLFKDLPGHADQVYAIDWSSDGEYVATGGKDRIVKVWHH